MYRERTESRYTLDVLRAAFILCVMLTGCFHHVADYCTGCQIVDSARLAARPPTVPHGKRAVVILVHGAFGFGPEWAPIVAALRASPEIHFVAFAWRGPWTRPDLAAHALTGLTQSYLDSAPLKTQQVLIIAHSAGGIIASYALRHARVPDGRHLSLAKVAAFNLPLRLDMDYERRINTPLGYAVGGTAKPIGNVPPGAEIVEYLTEDQHPLAPDAVEGRAVFLGSDAGHNRVLGRVGVPLIAAARDGAPPLGAVIR